MLYLCANRQCLSAIEKLCKGLYLLYVDDNVPRIHDISNLIRRFADKLPETVSDECFTFFDQLTGFYLNDRYPEYQQKTGATLSEPSAKLILNKTKELFQWLLTLKP
jgi:HEPN domain-containing protein